MNRVTTWTLSIPLFLPVVGVLDLVATDLSMPWFVYLIAAGFDFTGGAASVTFTRGKKFW